MIDIFIKNKELFKEHMLILAGGVKDEDDAYFQLLKKKVGGAKNIQLKPNISYNELLGLYLKARYYWHFAGYGVDSDRNPELVEHFGITPVEAMAMRAIPFCFNAGGPKELIADGINGYLFDTGEELLKKMASVMKSKSKQDEIKKNAHLFAVKNFSYEVYKQKLKTLL